MEFVPNGPHHGLNCGTYLRRFRRGRWSLAARRCLGGRHAPPGRRSTPPGQRRSVHPQSVAFRPAPQAFGATAAVVAGRARQGPCEIFMAMSWASESPVDELELRVGLVGIVSASDPRARRSGAELPAAPRAKTNRDGKSEESRAASRRLLGDACARTATSSWPNNGLFHGAPRICGRSLGHCSRRRIPVRRKRRSLTNERRGRPIGQLGNRDVGFRS